MLNKIGIILIMKEADHLCVSLCKYVHTGTVACPNRKLSRIGTVFCLKIALLIYNGQWFEKPKFVHSKYHQMFLAHC